MRIPIAYTLAWPERMPTPAPKLDLAQVARLDFEKPDMDRFPALRLAREALEAGGAAPIVLNAANEVAVGRFLGGSIRFPDIAATVQDVLETTPVAPPRSIGDVLDIDRLARERTEASMKAICD
jgi:1-deoxy-D-xylulose-5-phosphate reductoisomerase